MTSRLRQLRPHRGGRQEGVPGPGAVIGHRGDPADPADPAGPAHRRPAHRRIVHDPPMTVDEAAARMADLDCEFFLFTEAGSGQDGILHRAGPTGWRLSLVDPDAADGMYPTSLPLTSDTRPAPRLTAAQAVDWLEAAGLPFLLFVDADRRRASVAFRQTRTDARLLSLSDDAGPPGVPEAAGQGHYPAAVERAAARTADWLREVAEELGRPHDERYALRVLRGFLRTLRDRLPVDDAAHLAAQLPELLRGMYYEGWRPSTTPRPYRDLDTFLDLMRQEARLAGPTQTADCAEAVARVLRRRVTVGELRKVCATLPATVAALLHDPGTSHRPPAYSGTAYSGTASASSRGASSSRPATSRSGSSRSTR
jgi:uncharacterized protein (DUF2267 family)